MVKSILMEIKILVKLFTNLKEEKISNLKFHINYI